MPTFHGFRAAASATLVVVVLVAVPVAVLAATSDAQSTYCHTHPRVKKCATTSTLPSGTTSTSSASTTTAPTSTTPTSASTTSSASTSSVTTSSAPTLSNAPTSPASPFSSGTTSPAPASTAPTATVTPAQPAAIFWGSPSRWDSTIDQYAHPGGMVIAGRDNYQDQGFKDVHAAGGTVLVYLDAIVWNDYGTYHHLLFDSSACGAAVPQWPGPVSANGTGNLSDFRTVSDGGNGVLQGKLHCVLEKMVADNPHLDGFYMDDVGSRSWFPNFDWSTWGNSNQQAYRDGAIAIAQTTRQVADEHHLIYLVNGTWEKGTLSGAGGGYPDMGADGLSLADGGAVEHHDGQSSFFGPYACGSQWASSSAVTKGAQYMFDISSSSSGVTEYGNTNCFAWSTLQPTSAYDGVAPYSSSLWHPNGLS